MKFWTVVSKPNCPFCDKAISLLEEKEQIYAVVDLSDPKNTSFLEDVKYAGFRTVPIIFKPSGDLVGGYSELEEFFSA